MPRFMVERTFPSGLNVPITSDGAQACLAIVDKNGSNGVTWDSIVPVSVLDPYFYY